MVSFDRQIIYLTNRRNKNTNIYNLFIIFLLISNNSLFCQNLIPNGGFEQYSSCPVFFGDFNKVISWLNPNIGTPDYYHQCAGTNVGIPSNWGGHQIAHSGSAYVGLTLREGFNFREYIQIQFTSTLIRDTCYHFKMYINLANKCNKATDEIGVYFSSTHISSNNSSILPLTPQLNNKTGYITDTLNWTLVTGDYLSNGNENYLIIGNFKNDSATSLVSVNSQGQDITYYYIDDVSMFKIKNCSVGINKLDKNMKFTVGPNPFLHHIIFTVPEADQIEVSLLDISGYKICETKFINSMTLNTEQLEAGIYFYQLRNSMGKLAVGKLIKL